MFTNDVIEFTDDDGAGRIEATITTGGVSDAICALLVSA